MSIKSWWQREAQASFAWIIIGGLVAAFIALFFSWQLGFFCLLFMATAWWVWENPEPGFWLLIVLAPLLPMLKITQTIGTATLIKDVIILTLFTKQFLWPLIRRTLPYRRAALTAPIIWLVIWTIIEAARADNGLLLGILRARDIILYALLYFGVLYLPHSKRLMQQRLHWLLASAAVVLLQGIYQWWWAMDSAVLRFDPVRMIWIPRISSTLAHPSIFGQYAVSVSLLVGALVLFNKAASRRAGWFLFWLIILPFIWLTYSRAVWIGFVVGVGALITGWGAAEAAKKISKRTMLKIVIGLGVIGLLGIIGISRFTPIGVYVRSFVDPRYASNQERLEFMARLIAPMTDWEAMVGQGLGDVLVQNFRQNDIELYDIAVGNSRDVQLTKNRTLVDNQYLKTGVEMGLIGLLLYGWIYWRVLRSSVDNLKKMGPEGKIISLWGLGFLAAFVVQAFFIDIWDIWPTNAMFWIVAGLVGASSQMILTDETGRDK
jgi:hypothetical protein